jgi:ABC-type dipeptide/oligopeptide/nickel transport system permease subunit
LVLLGTDDLGKEKRQHRLVSLNNFSLILSIFVTVINVVLNVIVAIDPQLYSQTSNGTKVL